MSDNIVIVARLRRFLLLLCAALCLGIVVELVLTGHYKEPLQLVPLALCGAGLINLIWVWLRPNRTSICVLRIVMIVAGLSSVAGMLAHWNGNLALAREVNAAKANAAPIWVALTGRNPALAPGAMAITAVVALAATYAHSALHDKGQ